MDNPAAVTTIYGLFGQTGRQFAVPPYQRAYSWEVGGKDHVGQFLRDIQEQPSDRNYYLGHFLFERENDRLLVIDGQQRLTTVVLFMGALAAECNRREIERLDGTEVEEIRETYLNHRVQKFRTVPEDAAYFDARVVDGDAGVRCTTGRKSEKRLSEAADFFADALKKATTEELAMWFRAINNAVATTYTIGGQEAKEIATQIFAFQNDRGKPLTMLEKTKAWVMHQLYKHSKADAVDADIRTVESHFATIYGLTEALKRENEDTVLGWHCQAYLDANASGGSALETVKKALSGEDDIAKWLKGFTAGLAETFRFVAELEKVEERRGGLLADICYLDKSHAMPLLVKMGHFGQLDLARGTCEALELIENILFKLIFTTAPYRTNSLVQFAREFDGENYETLLLPRLREAAEKGFKWYWDFNGNCRRYFTENRWHYVREIKYVLYKYENDLRENPGGTTPKTVPLSIDECAAIFRENKTVENTLDHITPQNPDFTEYSDAFRRDYLCNLGNLSLLTWSSNASKNNHDPTLPEIREKYNTPYRSQEEILNVLCKGKWKEDEIEARRRKIVAFVIKHWHLGEPESFPDATT